MLQACFRNRTSVSGVVFGETSVGHSGTYKCEPGAAPAAKVLVHVIDGERDRKPAKQCNFERLRESRDPK